ncbi:MAG: hypothetical protein GY910_14015 [bacterium]|nr:hypothetical protein [bacterium]
MRREETSDGVGGLRRRRRRGGRWMAAAAAALVMAMASPVAADEYGSSEAGHPLRIVAYVLHPIGLALDYLLLRPAHWLVSQEPFKTAFGHED